MSDEPGPSGEVAGQRELLSRLRAAVEAKDAENAVLRRELNAAAVMLTAYGNVPPEQAAALAGRLPGAGMFRLFLEQQGGQDRFRFGREADGSPSGPWGWHDLN